MIRSIDESKLDQRLQTAASLDNGIKVDVVVVVYVFAPNDS